MNPAPEAWPAPPLPESALRAWLASSADWLLLVDSTGRIDWCNPAFQRAAGTLAAGALQALPATDDATRDSTHDGTGGRAVQLATADGGSVAVQARSMRCGDLTLWTLRDLTEHRDALRQAAERTALITRHAGIGTWDVDFDGTAEHWDEQMFRLRGLVPGAVVPNREARWAMVHPDDLARVREASPENATNTGVLAYEFRVLMPDGGYRWIASRSAPVRDAQGRVHRRVGVNWDATESKRAALAEQQASLAERASQAKSKLLSRVSHELRTPLNAVLGFTQLLETEARQSGAVDWLAKLGHIRAAGEELLALTTDLLDRSSRDDDDAAAAAVATESLPGTAGPATAPAKPAPADAAERTGSILYIEDNPINVMLVEQMVMTLPGLALVAEPDGASGVARARQLRPDLILIDLQLPDFDGYEVLRRLRAQPETADSRCIALSANAMPDDIARGLQAGFAAYWTKPIDFKAFLAGLDALFPLSR